MPTTLLSHAIHMPSTCLSHAIRHQINISFHSTKSHFTSFHSTTFNNVIVALNGHSIFTSAMEPNYGCGSKLATTCAFHSTYPSLLIKISEEAKLFQRPGGH